MIHFTGTLIPVRPEARVKKGDADEMVEERKHFLYISRCVASESQPTDVCDVCDVYGESEDYTN